MAGPIRVPLVPGTAARSVGGIPTATASGRIPVKAHVQSGHFVKAHTRTKFSYGAGWGPNKGQHVLSSTRDGRHRQEIEVMSARVSNTDRLKVNRSPFGKIAYGKGWTEPTAPSLRRLTRLFQKHGGPEFRGFN